MPNEVTLQSEERLHPVDENIRPILVGGEPTALQLSKTDVRVNNFHIDGIATGGGFLALTGGSMTGDINTDSDIVSSGNMAIEVGASDFLYLSSVGDVYARFQSIADNYTQLRIYEDPGGADNYSILVAEHGATRIATQDVAGAEADLTLNIDGFIDINSASGEHITLDAGADITLDAAGGNITLLDAGSTYTPTAASDATTKTYVDSQTVVTATAYSARVNATSWHLANNQTFQDLTGTDTTVGDTQDLGILSNFDMRCLMYIVPFHMTVHAVSGSVMDDDMDDTVDKRMGIWRLPSLAVSGADPGSTNPDTLTLAYITDAFGSDIALGAGRVCAFYDTSADFALTAGDGIFMAYLNPQSAGNDDVALTMSIWAHQTTP